MGAETGGVASMRSGETPALEIRGVSKAFGELAVLRDVSVTIAPGERHAIIGPNGAGKTTLLSIVSGSIRPDAGSIRLNGRAIHRLPEYERAQIGLARTFQTSALFETLSTRENVAISAQQAAGESARPLKYTGHLVEVEAEVDEALEAVNLSQRGHVIVSELAYGERRQLELAMALAGRPTLLLLDEPVAGMSASERHRFVRLVSQLSEELTCIFIEHDMDVVMSTASRISVLVAGTLLLQGSPGEVAASPEVRKAYFGSRSLEGGSR